MNEFLTLTDSVGEDCIIRKENVVSVWEDHRTQGNPPAIVHGSTVLLSTGGSLFVRERAADVIAMLEEVP